MKNKYKVNVKFYIQGKAFDPVETTINALSELHAKHLVSKNIRKKINKELEIKEIIVQEILKKGE